MMWRRVGPIVTVVVLAACGGEPAPRPSGSVIETLSPSSEAPSSPDPEPGEMPASITGDLPPSEIPPDDLVPVGADVTGVWFAFTDRGVMVVIAWVEPGSDFTRLPRGFAVWRRHDEGPHWRADLVRRHDPEDEIREIQITTDDMTGDGSDDALVFEGIGGLGGGGPWSVVG